jgi:phenylacetate-CoA ligase
MAYIDLKTDPQQRRTEVLQLVDMFEKFARLPLADAKKYQLLNFQNLLKTAKTQSPWWAERLSEVDFSVENIEELIQQFEFETKSNLQENRDQMAVRLPESELDDYTFQKTSGSTSQPVQILKYLPLYFRELDAVALLEWSWQRRDIRKKMGFFRLGANDSDAIPLGPPLEYLGDAPLAFQRSSVDRTPAELLDSLAVHRPAYLLSNPVSLRLVAQEQLSNPRNIEGLEQVLTLADRVDTSLRQLVRDVFGAKIVDRYSAVEFGPIAIQCPVFEHLHVVSPLVYVEILDEENKNCAVGEPGRVVVTGLRTLAMPIIRYELGDIAEWGEVCDAGIKWPVIANVHGRQRTFTVGADGQERLITLFGADFMMMQEIMDYQVIKFDDSVVFAAQVRRPLVESEMERIRKSMHEVFRSQLDVHFYLQTEPIQAIAWKNQELYIADGNFQDGMTLSDVHRAVKTEH